MTETHKVKTCVIGNASVGKTSLIIRINENRFIGHTNTTPGVDYNSKSMKINDEEVLVEIWDTTGQDKFRHIVSNFLRGADGIFLVFDMSSPSSLMELKFWIQQLDQVVGKNIPKVILGNKTDLKKFLTSEEDSVLSKYLEENINIKFYRVSAKTGQGIHQALEHLTSEAYFYSCANSNKVKRGSVILKSHKKNLKRRCC